MTACEADGQSSETTQSDAITAKALPVSVATATATHAEALHTAPPPTSTSPIAATTTSTTTNTAAPCSINDKQEQRSNDANKVNQSPSNALSKATANGNNNTNISQRSKPHDTSHTAFATIVSAAPDSKPNKSNSVNDSAALEFAGDASSFRYGTTIENNFDNSVLRCQRSIEFRRSVYRVFNYCHRQYLVHLDLIRL